MYLPLQAIYSRMASRRRRTEIVTRNQSALVLRAVTAAVLWMAVASLRSEAQQAATYRLTGLVTDSARVPIPQTEVAVVRRDSVLQLVSTGADGRFALGELPAGSISLRVRRLGYQQRVIDVQVGERGQPALVEIILAESPGKLEEVSVNSPGGRLLEFYQRKEQRKAFGKFLEENEIRRLGVTNASDLFRSVPGIAIRNSSAGGNTIRVRNCQPTVWVDGQRIPGAELDEVAQPGDIAAIEFYPSSAGIPAQYMDRSNRLCGLILVWMKTR